MHPIVNKQIIWICWFLRVFCFCWFHPQHHERASFIQSWQLGVFCKTYLMFCKTRLNRRHNNGQFNPLNFRMRHAPDRILVFAPFYFNKKKSLLVSDLKVYFQKKFILSDLKLNFQILKVIWNYACMQCVYCAEHLHLNNSRLHRKHMCFGQELITSRRLSLHWNSTMLCGECRW
jgi:hypothetical protein